MTKRLQRIVVLQTDGTYTVMAGQRTIKGGFGSVIEADEFVRTEPSRRASVPKKNAVVAPKNMQLTDTGTPQTAPLNRKETTGYSRRR